MPALPAKHKLAVVDDENPGHEHSAKYGGEITCSHCWACIKYQSVKQKEKTHHHRRFWPFIPQDQFQFIGYQISLFAKVVQEWDFGARFFGF